MPEGFKSDRFRFLARTITASEEAPTEGSDGEIRIKPNLYILVWEPSFYEELLTRDYFFLFPPEILKQHTLVFQMYSYFRSRMARRHSDCMLLSELNQKLARNIDWRRFSMDLIRELRKLGEAGDQEDTFLVNLWGYHLTITALIEKGKRQTIKLILNVTWKKYYVTREPVPLTLANVIWHQLCQTRSATRWYSKQKLEELSEIIDGEFEPIQRKAPSPRGKLGRRVKQRKHSVEINADEIMITLSKYTSAEAPRTQHNGFICYDRALTRLNQRRVLRAY